MQKSISIFTLDLESGGEISFIWKNGPAFASNESLGQMRSQLSGTLWPFSRPLLWSFVPSYGKWDRPPCQPFGSNWFPSQTQYKRKCQNAVQPRIGTQLAEDAYFWDFIWVDFSPFSVLFGLNILPEKYCSTQKWSKIGRKLRLYFHLQQTVDPNES